MKIEEAVLPGPERATAGEKREMLEGRTREEKCAAESPPGDTEEKLDVTQKKNITLFSRGSVGVTSSSLM